MRIMWIIHRADNKTPWNHSLAAVTGLFITGQINILQLMDAWI